MVSSPAPNLDAASEREAIVHLAYAYIIGNEQHAAAWPDDADDMRSRNRALQYLIDAVDAGLHYDREFLIGVRGCPSPKDPAPGPATEPNTKADHSGPPTVQ